MSEIKNNSKEKSKLRCGTANKRNRSTLAGECSTLQDASIIFRERDKFMSEKKNQFFKSPLSIIPNYIPFSFEYSVIIKVY